MSWINEGKVPRTKVPGSESLQELSFPGARGPGHFAAGSEMAKERTGQGPIGQFVPGSELARERKGCESSPRTYGR